MFHADFLFVWPGLKTITRIRAFDNKYKLVMCLGQLSSGAVADIGRSAFHNLNEHLNTR